MTFVEVFRFPYAFDRRLKFGFVLAPEMRRPMFCLSRVVQTSAPIVLSNAPAVFVGYGIYSQQFNW